MTDFEKLAKKLANILLSTPIGRTMNVYHPEQERIDMAKQDFQELKFGEGRMIGGPDSPADHCWRMHEGLMTTERGLYLWTCYSHPDGHKFVKLLDDKLWEWGYE